jgi:phosphinothricin acetyltransferase
MDLHQAFAVITMPNEKSEQFHRKFGFESFAIFKEVGFKFNQWHDVLWMKKSI